MKVSELIGVQLDFWVARALGYDVDITKMKQGDKWCAIEQANVRAPNPAEREDETCAIATVPNAIQPFLACVLGWKEGRGKHPRRAHWFYPSTLWDHGGPIIECEKIEWRCDEVWYAGIGQVIDGTGEDDWKFHGIGPTPLIAAMRCFVASKFGDTVPSEAVTLKTLAPTKNTA